MRNAMNGLGRNLASGLRLALFMRVDRSAFRISVAQLAHCAEVYALAAMRFCGASAA